MEYCPCCIEKLTRQSKKLGEFTVWLVCPKCGYRTRPESDYLKNKKLDEFDDYKERLNDKKYKE